MSGKDSLKDFLVQEVTDRYFQEIPGRVVSLIYRIPNAHPLNRGFLVHASLACVDKEDLLRTEYRPATFHEVRVFSDWMEQKGLVLGGLKPYRNVLAEAVERAESYESVLAKSGGWVKGYDHARRHILSVLRDALTDEMLSHAFTRRAVSLSQNFIHQASEPPGQMAAAQSAVHEPPQMGSVPKFER